MKKIDFQNKKSNLFRISNFVRRNNLEHINVLDQAFEQNVLVENNKNLLSNFINSIKNKKDIKSQLYQDMFASFIIGDKFNKTFFEFGATNGIDLSNSYTLEKYLNWKGALSEPSPQWYDELRKNRPHTNIISECIWSESNKELNFFVSDIGVFSSLEDFKESDKTSMPGNTQARLKSGKNIIVKTISLNDIIEKQFNSKAPSYISIDTEGSEYEILKSFNFKKYRPLVFTVEHNFTELQLKIDELMYLNEYIRVFKSLTAFDAWYVTKEVFDEINN
ncbi:FkbM family methyltransferase [Pelagibacteraceae bacterium]|nr:FkbM family methyltransferase [Pelagibacteraceae bacterium]